MKKLAVIAAVPVTASVFTLYLWAKIMETFDDMLAGMGDIEDDWEHDDIALGLIPPLPTLPPRLEGTGEAQRDFDRRMWDYEMEKRFHEDG